jgi:hypothetical protein
MEIISHDENLKRKIDRRRIHILAKIAKRGILHIFLLEVLKWQSREGVVGRERLIG